MQLEPIVKVRFKKFVEQYELNPYNESKNFEIYVNYLIFTSHQTEVFSIKNELFDLINVGGCDDLGLDGIGIKINDSFISSIDDIKEYIKIKKKMHIELFFIQSKYRPNFVASEFLTFTSGVFDAVSEKRYKKANSQVKYWLEIIDFILSDEVMLLWEKKPSIRVYFTAMGKWTNDTNIIAYENKLRDDIINTNNYEEINVHYIDTNSLLKIITNNENNFEITISIGEQISFPEVQFISNGALIYTDSDELMKLLKTDDLIIRKSLFYDNVRSYQGDTSINEEIYKTIESEPEKFILFNNGVTIVCDQFILAGRKATIKNPQIVNGCQTCNVIYNFYAQHEFNSVKIPLAVKIIATENNEIVNQIVRSTNKQNIVLDEVFEITRDFHKNLEKYFLDIPPVNSNHKLFYERRSKQFLGDYSIKSSQKINLRILTQSSVAILFEAPHLAHSHEATLLKEYKDKIFLDIHSYEAYHTTAEIYSAFDSFFSQNINERKIYKTYQFHLMMIFKLIIASNMPSLSDMKGIDKYCEKIKSCLKSDELCQNNIKNSITIFDNTRRIWENKLKRSKFAVKDNADFTKEIFKQISEFTKAPVEYNKTEMSRAGLVISVKKDKHNKFYGFIKANPQNIPFFESMNEGIPFLKLYGNFVLYDLVPNYNGDLVASNVKLFKA